MATVNKYLANQVLTADPVRLHMLLVDGAIRFSLIAAPLLDEKQYMDAGEALQSARDCVLQLASDLDATSNSELVANLRALFAFVFKKLDLADIHHNPADLQEAIQVLKLHRENWQALIDQLALRNAG